MLKKTLERYSKWGVKPTAVGIFLLGVAMLATWVITRDNTNMSMLLLLAGIALVAIAIILYFLSPSRYIRSDVCDAMAIASTEDVYHILSSLLVNAKGIYLPPSQAGAMKLFIPLSINASDEDIGKITLGNSLIFNVEGKSLKGIVIDPPGQGLYRYSRKIGALYTFEGLDSEIKDLLENGLELASGVKVVIGNDQVHVSIKRIANAGMCAELRKDNPAICEQIGCPICSLLGCIIADGTGEKVRAKSINVQGNRIDAFFDLLGD
ncbi:MAG: hypothetical protein NC238_16105 [Dehalobacter sp.]|nr:hypothetical protein [Dehalobacter sp.]